MDSPDLETFLATPAESIAAYGQTRADSLGLTLPPAVQAGVFDNLAQLRTQVALVAAALDAADNGPILAFRP